MAAKQDSRWRGEVTEVFGAPIDKVWPVLTDFGGLHKNFPQIFEICDTVEGERNKVGSLRAVASPLPDGSKVQANERLLSVDDVNHTTSYAVEYINLGWTNYKGKIVAKSVGNGQTCVEWGFELDPVSNQTEEEFLSLQLGLFKRILDLTKGLVAE